VSTDHMKPRRPGRPPVYRTLEERRQANAEAARRYRAKKKATALARKDSAKPLESSIIALDSLPAWRRK